MCGRYTLRKEPGRLREHFDLRNAPVWNARFNIAPAQAVPMVVAGAEGREWRLAEWGLKPAWLTARGGGEARRGGTATENAAAGPGSGLAAGGARGVAERGWINARAETVMAKPAFRDSYRQRRCLLPADGFYEWRNEGGTRRPHFFQRRNGEIFAFAGLWEPLEVAGHGIPARSCAIVTTRANALVAAYHDRMPVILRQEEYSDWLAPDMGRATALLRPFPPEQMEARPAAAQWVNSARYDGPNCLAL